LRKEARESIEKRQKIIKLCSNYITTVLGEKLYFEDLMEINSIQIANLHKCSGPLRLKQKEQNNKINHLYYYLNNYTINIHLNYFK